MNYCAMGDLLLNGTRYHSGQAVNLTGIDARTIALLIEQRRIAPMLDNAPTPTPMPIPEPKRKAA